MQYLSAQIPFMTELILAIKFIKNSKCIFSLLIDIFWKLIAILKILYLLKLSHLFQMSQPQKEEGIWGQLVTQLGVLLIHFSTLSVESNTIEMND